MILIYLVWGSGDGSQWLRKWLQYAAKFENHCCNQWLPTLNALSVLWSLGPVTVEILVAWDEIWALVCFDISPLDFKDQPGWRCAELPCGGQETHCPLDSSSVCFNPKIIPCWIFTTKEPVCWVLQGMCQWVWCSLCSLDVYEASNNHILHYLLLNEAN